MVFLEKKDSIRADSNEDLDPGGHLSILLNLIQQIHESTSPVNRSRYQYSQVYKQIGAKIIEERILRSLEMDFNRLIEARRLNLNTIKLCENGKARYVFGLACIFMECTTILTLITSASMLDHPVILEKESRNILRI